MARRCSMMRSAVTGPTPWSVSSSSNVAVFRSILVSSVVAGSGDCWLGVPDCDGSAVGSFRVVCGDGSVCDTDDEATVFAALTLARLTACCSSRVRLAQSAVSSMSNSTMACMGLIPRRGCVRGIGVGHVS